MTSTGRGRVGFVGFESAGKGAGLARTDEPKLMATRPVAQRLKKNRMMGYVCALWWPITPDSKYHYSSSSHVRIKMNGNSGQQR